MIKHCHEDNDVNKSFIAAVTIALMLISTFGLQLVKEARADPFFIFHQVDPVPGTIPPNITISSPQNNTVYASNEVTISFDVNKPELGACQANIIDVTYILDNERTDAFSIWRGGSASNAWAVPEFNTSFVSPWLPAGTHSLTVSAQGVVYCGGMDIFFINSSSTTLFIITSTQALKSSPAPTLTVTTPTLTSSSPSPFSISTAKSPVLVSPAHEQPFLMITLFIGLVSAVIAFSVLLHKQHRKTVNLSR
jgi:hypothetical protein